MSTRFVYFDLGNILLYFSVSRLLHQMSEVTGASEEDLKSIIFSEKKYLALESGEITSSEYFSQICSDLGRPVDPEKFLEAANNIFWANDSIIPVIKRLHKTSFPRGILSNTGPQHWEYVLNAFAFIGKYFPRHRIASYAVRCMKPQKEIFEIALKEAQTELPDLRPDEILFTDDLEDNVQGARNFGFQAFVYTDTPALIREFAQRNIPLPESKE